MYSPSIDKLLYALKKLPSVGERTAERFVFHWLKSGKKEVTELMLALKELIDNIKSCEVCCDFSDTNPCPTCRNNKRDHSIICVVTDPQDLMVIERTAVYQGSYHVIRNTIDPSDLESLERTKIAELLERIKGTKVFFKDRTVKEVVLALSPDMAGETTMLYLEKEIKNINPEIKITRLARGLPIGADLRYADEITLGSAMKNRTSR